MIVASLHTDEPFNMKEGTVLIFLGENYSMDYQHYTQVFEVIGEPIKDKRREIQFVSGSDGKYHEILEPVNAR